MALFTNEEQVTDTKDSTHENQTTNVKLHESQREGGFNGGIPQRMSVIEGIAKKMDSCMKELRDEFSEELEDKGFVVHNILHYDEMRRYGMTLRIMPDGGLWYKNGRLVAAFEVKTQGKGGNAIERWSHMKDTVRRLNPGARFVTFGSREGFIEGEKCHKFAQHHLGELNRVPNHLYNDGISWFINDQGFSRDEIRDIMYKAITCETL